LKEGEVADLGRPAMTVAAGLLERDGLILIAQRRADHKHGLKWEFPGGKVEATETPREALARELEEELGVRAVIGEEITRYEYEYPGRPPIYLIFFWVGEFEGEPENRVFEQIRWEAPGRFGEYDFLDGDVDFVRRMAEGEV
jgi:8-oxo-dGTP diphosphatase